MYVDVFHRHYRSLFGGLCLVGKGPVRETVLVKGNQARCSSQRFNTEALLFISMNHLTLK